MSRDYAKTRETRRRGRPAANKAKSNFTWLIVGAAMGLIIAGLSFLKHRVTASVHPDQRLIVDEPVKSKAHKDKPAKVKPAEDEQDKVNFDFYTILPNEKVKAPAAEEISPPKPKEKALADEIKPSTEAPVVSARQVQNLEQNLLAPNKPAKISHQTLKPVAEESASKSASEKPALKTNSEETSAASKKTEKPAAKVAAAKKDKVEKAAIADTKKAKISALAAEMAKEEAASKAHAVHHKSGAPIVDLTETRAAKEKVIPVMSAASYIVQIAAFKHFEDADRLKAQLNLAGYEAKVKSVPVNGTTWHRVWLGPYGTVQAAEKIQKDLLTKHTKGVVVKVK